MNARNVQHRPEQEADVNLEPANTQIIAGFTPNHYYNLGYDLPSYPPQEQVYLPT
jgi:hypothetical protein